MFSNVMGEQLPPLDFNVGPPAELQAQNSSPEEPQGQAVNGCWVGPRHRTRGADATQNYGSGPAGTLGTQPQPGKAAGAGPPSQWAQKKRHLLQETWKAEHSVKEGYFQALRFHGIYFIGFWTCFVIAIAARWTKTRVNYHNEGK